MERELRELTSKEKAIFNCGYEVATIDMRERFRLLEQKNAVLVEALELISSPSEFNCAIGEGNLRATARAALEKIKGME
jgi:hypothetical protein